MIAEVFQSFGVEHVVLSPGSRNGALATHFSHHPKFKTYSIVDERCAGFVGLGMAQQLRKPVVLCCTSGSALVNYYPAVTEAFYQNIPLIILSADRPEHLIDNFDGQTIRQKNILEKHTYFNIQLKEDETTEIITENLTNLKKAVLNSMHNSGPVHINMPFSEPIYEFQNTIDIQFEKFKIIEKENEKINTGDFCDLWNSYQKKMILVGLQYPNQALNDWIDKLAEDDSVLVFTETTSNIYNKRFFNKIDSVIYSLSDEMLEELKPEILLTIGQNVVSKKIKSFFRKHSPKHHWHLDEHWHPNTFQCLTEKIKSKPLDFLHDFVPYILPQKTDYYKKWNSIRIEKQEKQKDFAENIQYSDFKVFEKLIKTFPEKSIIQYGNSSVIRYAQLFEHKNRQKVFCNRGTSGIEGSTSTAVGASMVVEQQTILITGDISFFYDSNGLWNSYIPKNFRIILINNGGGNIFRIIPGPENSGVMEKVFETKHELSAEYLAKMFDFEYIKIHSLKELDSELKTFYNKSENPKIMEINTSNVDNAEIMRNYFRI